MSTYKRKMRWMKCNVSSSLTGQSWMDVLVRKCVIFGSSIKVSNFPSIGHDKGFDTWVSKERALDLGVFCAFLWINTSVHSWWWWYLQKAVQCTIPATSNTVCLLSVRIKQEAGERAQPNPWWVNQWMNPLIDYSVCSVVSRLVSGWHFALVRIQNTASGKWFSSSFWIPVNSRYHMFDQYSFLLPTQICRSGSSE